MTEPARGRGRPRKHPSWFDNKTQSWRALRDHPNYDVCRNFLARVHDSDANAELLEQELGIRPARIHRTGFDSDYSLVDEWLDVAAFTYGVATDCGMRPGRYYDLKPLDPSSPIGPGNVKWKPRGWAPTRRAREAKRYREERKVKTPSGAYVLGAFVDSLTHKPSCESTYLAPLICPCCSAEVEEAESW